MIHFHHIIPRHAGGSDEPWNIIPLTILEHAEAHMIRYYLYGQWQDRIAWLAISNQITYDEAMCLSIREGIKEKNPNGRTPWNKGKTLHYMPPKAFKKGQQSGAKNAFYGHHHTEEFKETRKRERLGIHFRTKEGDAKHSLKMKGRKQSPEHIQKRIEKTMQTKRERGLI